MLNRWLLIAAIFAPIRTVNAQTYGPNIYPIIRLSDPEIVTHKARAGEAVFGVSALGGGYLNYFDVGHGNIVSARYGRGWQGSIRDDLHSGRYNPTQAGFTDRAGAPARVVVDRRRRRILIPPFQMPLFSDPVFDFTEHENLAPDYRGYDDNNNSDKDGVDEIFLDQDDEVRSEFDYQGHYDDVTAQFSGHGVKAALHHIYRNSYVRTPQAIYQFGEKAVRENGEIVLDKRHLLEDISPLLPGKQTATPIDLANIRFSAYGVRLLTSSGYTSPMWFTSAGWQHLSRNEIEGRGNEKRFQTSTSEPRRAHLELLELPLLILAKNPDPNRAMAVGLYAPHSRRNEFQTIGRSLASGAILYQEDRRFFSFMELSNVIPEQISMRTRYFTTGLLAPNRAKPGVFEGIRHETYIFYGTPTSILNAVRAIKE